MRPLFGQLLLVLAQHKYRLFNPNHNTSISRFGCLNRHHKVFDPIDNDRMDAILAVAYPKIENWSWSHILNNHQAYSFALKTRIDVFRNVQGEHITELKVDNRVVILSCCWNPHYFPPFSELHKMTQALLQDKWCDSPWGAIGPAPREY